MFCCGSKKYREVNFNDNFVSLNNFIFLEIWQEFNLYDIFHSKKFIEIHRKTAENNNNRKNNCK